MTLLKLCWAFVFLLIYSSLVFSAEFRAQFIPEKNVTNKAQTITHLTWDEEKDTKEPLLRVRPPTQQEPGSYFVVLHGKYSGDRKIIYGTQIVSLKAGGSFDLEVEIEGEQTKITLKLVDYTGSVFTETSAILFPDWADFLESVTPFQMKLSFKSGLGMSTTSYSQPDSTSATKNNFSELGLNLYSEGRFDWMRNLSLRAQASMTGLPIAMSTSGYAIRLLDLNAQVIYPLRFRRSVWSIELLGNYSYRTTFQSSSFFGFSNVQGLTIYPRIERKLSKDKMAWAEMKFMPILGGFVKFLSGSSYELSLKVGYQGLRWGTHEVELMGGVTLFSLQYEGGSTGTIQTNTYTLGANYLF